MKAWHVQDKDGEYQEIVFADKRSEAISKSEAIGWVDFVDIRARRAKYCDDLENDSDSSIKARLENGWWFECHGSNCFNQITIDDKHEIMNGNVYCGKCKGD